MSVELIETLQSSNIEKLLYNSDSEVLEITYKSGKVYLYFDVPKEAWDSLKTAESFGSHVAQHIKGKYLYELVPDA
jgi:predicted component of type VI protein secretion system